jgi:type VI secretion system secreted protein VgrG
MGSSYRRLCHDALRTLFAGLTAGAILFGQTFSIGEASPLNQALAPTLGTAASFAVLGGATVTNTGPTLVNADLGVSPGSAITGFPPGLVVGGTIHAADALAASAQADTTTSYNMLAGQACPGGNNLTGQDLGGLVLVPGVYCFTGSAQLTGALTLNTANPAAVYVFQIASTLTTATNSSVAMTPGGSPCNVFWQVGSSATLGTTTNFIGSILALTTITLTTGAAVNGRALARNGAVTLDSNTIGSSTCTVGLPTATPSAIPTATPSATPVPPAPQSNPTQRPAPTAVFPPTPTITPVPPAAATSVAAATATPTALPPATATAVSIAAAAGAAPPAAAAPEVAGLPVAAPPAAQTPPDAAPPGEDTPPAEDTPPGGPPVAQTPPNTAPPGAGTPPGAPPAQVPPRAAPPPVQVPSALPRTGAGPADLPIAFLSVLLGGLAVAAGATLRRSRK